MSISLTAVPSWRMWTVWGAGALGYVVAQINRSSLSAVGVDAAERFHADASILSMFAVLQLVMYAVMQVPAGMLLDRFGARAVLSIGVLLMGLGQGILAFSPDVGFAIAGRMIVGTGDATVFLGCLRLIALWFPAQRAPMLVQLTSVIGQGGSLLGIMPFSMLLHATSWSTAFGSLAGLGLLAAAILFAVIRNRPPGRTADISVNTETGVITVVSSAIDPRTGIRAALAHPGTRLAFWSHFTTLFPGLVFLMLWGMPFLTIGQGIPPASASAVIASYVVVGIIAGPIIGIISGRYPNRRSPLLVFPAIGLQIIVWTVVLLWPGPAPFGLLLLLACSLAIGASGSMVAFDHVRNFNSPQNISTASGVANVGGFLAGLLAIFFVGLALDLQGASRPENYSLDAFKIAFLVQYPLWIIGIVGILVERRRTRIRLGILQARARKTRD